MKVVWICSVSNQELRTHLNLKLPWWHKLIRFITHRNKGDGASDYAIWNTNALREFNSIEDVDLHVIFTHANMKNRCQSFKEANIRYYAVNASDTSFRSFMRVHFGNGFGYYKKTWQVIANLVKDIQPEIIHLMGAENPPYSLSILQLPKNIPIITQLQTLLCDPNADRYLNETYKHQIACERQVLLRSDYIGSRSTLFPKIVREQIRKDAVFVNTRLTVAEKTDLSYVDKQFDFVYWANFIAKSIDLAIEAFGIASKKHPGLTLDIIGGVSDSEIQQIDSRLKELGVRDYVFFEGKLPTHENVLVQIKKSRFALLPLKTDIVSGTIREAMWNGLPVVTTITQGTPLLNIERDSVLLSEIGDHEAMANNMLRLVDNPALAKHIRTNAAITVEDRYGNNRQRILEWIETYRACIANFHYNTPLPEHLLNIN